MEWMHESLLFSGRHVPSLIHDFDIECSAFDENDLHEFLPENPDAFELLFPFGEA